MYSFPYLEPACCSMTSSNCSFLTCIQVSQKAGQVVWYSHLFKNLLQFVVIHTALCIKWKVRCGISGKGSTYQCRRCKRYRFSPWLGRSSGVGIGNPLQDSCLEDPMERASWWAGVQRRCKELGMTEHTHKIIFPMPLYFESVIIWSCKLEDVTNKLHF